ADRNNKAVDRQLTSLTSANKSDTTTPSKVVAKPAAGGIKQGPPKALARQNPIYPPRARSMQAEGQVKVRFDVNQQGRLESIRVLSAKPKNMVERSVISGMKRWRYEQREAKGLIVTIIFRLDGQAVVM